MSRARARAVDRPRLAIARPSAALAGAPAEAPAVKPEGRSRVVVDLEPWQHVAIKRRALEKRQTVREYVLELVARDGAFQDGDRD